MDRQKVNKLNKVLQLWPKGTVAPTSWLKANGVSRQLLARYEQYSWVKRLGKGAVVRPNEKVFWWGAVYSVQKLAKRDFWVGGKSSLEQQGIAHYIKMSKPEIHLYSNKLRSLPSWTNELGEMAQFHAHTLKLFKSKAIDNGFTELEKDSLSIKVSTAERAIMETLDGVPNETTFDEARLLFENLSTLRPELCQELLESCTSIKVKRLFLFFAEHSGHAWFSKLNASKINLGMGKRSIVLKGKLDQKYQITVPKEL
jgi:hypothetical protein